MTCDEYHTWSHVNFFQLLSTSDIKRCKNYGQGFLSSLIPQTPMEYHSEVKSTTDFTQAYIFAKPKFFIQKSKKQVKD